MAGFARLSGPVVLVFGLLSLSPVAAMAPVPAKSAAGPVITGVTLNPASTQLQQHCPVTLVFHGDITTTRPATVTYTWGILMAEVGRHIGGGSRFLASAP